MGKTGCLFWENGHRPLNLVLKSEKVPILCCSLHLKLRNKMKLFVQIIITIGLLFQLSSQASAQSAKNLGTEEFGLTPRQLVKIIEQVEGLISKCMRSEGFEYIAADYNTVRKGMNADKRLPGIGESEFISKYGFGVATMYTGRHPQLSRGYQPGRVGLGERNVQIFNNLSKADQTAYNRTLFGKNTDATFAVGLEIENFSRTGGCTRRAIEQVFKPEQLLATYYNPKDALINKDPRMKKAIRKFANEIRKAGFDYNHPDEVETDIRDRLSSLTNGSTIPVEKMSLEQLIALEKLQDYERRVAIISFQLAEEIFDPVEAMIEKEMFARKVK